MTISSTVRRRAPKRASPSNARRVIGSIVGASCPGDKGTRPCCEQFKSGIDKNNHEDGRANSGLRFDGHISNKILVNDPKTVGEKSENSAGNGKRKERFQANGRKRRLQRLALVLCHRQGC